VPAFRSEYRPSSPSPGPRGARRAAVEHRYESWRTTNYLEEAMVARVWLVMRERRWEGMEKEE
jgi:hypothetical protein